MDKKQINVLNELLKGEHMAINIYKKTRKIQGDPQVHNMLLRFEEDHKNHAKFLTQRISELGGVPKGGTGFIGIMANGMGIVNALRGPEHLLLQVYNGEDKGVHAYEDRMDKLDPVSQDLVSSIMADDHEHLKYFKTRMEKENSE